MKISLLIAFIWVSAFAIPLNAQSAEILDVKGRVSDEFGIPMAGVLIRTENGKHEAMTDREGLYTISIGDGSQTIRFSFGGYKNHTVKLADSGLVDVKMKNDAHRTDEMIDLGYTSQTRNSITGSVATVSGEQLEKYPVANLSQAMNGNLLGVTSMEYNADLSGSEVWSLVRSISSVNGREPTIVIDGVICPNTSFEYITPKEIESITVLKDAATTAIYGIQGANGVIVITTKRGHAGKVRVGVNFDQSFQVMTRKPEAVSSGEYAALRNQAGYNDGLGEFSQFSSTDVDKFRSGENRELYPNTDYYDMFMQPFASMQRAGVNVSGGNDVVRYYSNVNFMHQSIPFKVDGNKKYDPTPTNYSINYRTNINLKINKYLEGFLLLSGNVRRLKTTQHANNTIYSHIFNLTPTMYGPLTPIIDNPDDPSNPLGGQVITHDNENFPVYGMLNRSGFSKQLVTNIISQAGLKLDMSFLTKGLSMTGTMAYQTNSNNISTTFQDFERWVRTDNSSQLEFVKKGTATNSALIYGKQSRFFYNMNFFGRANYDRTFGNHSISAMAYVFYLQQDRESWSSWAGTLPYRRQSLGVTATYAFKNSLYVKADLGYSGSDQFAPKKRFVTTPAISAGWVISNEAFMSDVKWISNLKLRASYGVSANDQLGTDQRFLYLDDFTEANGLDGLRGNPNLVAEKMKKQNYGIDLGILNSLSLSVDYYRGRTDNMLISGAGSVPEYQGVHQNYYAKVNDGVMENSGVEIGINYLKRLNRDFTVFGALNFSQYTNKVINVNEPGNPDDYAYQYRTTGYTVGQQWGYIVDNSNGNGYFNTQQELDNSKLNYSFGTPRLGDFIYKDLNGDQEIDEKDRAPIGYSNIPSQYYSFSAGLTYKQFDFSFMFQGAGKVSAQLQGVGTYEYGGQGVFSDIHKNAWTQERYDNGDKITYPALSLGESVNHRANSFFIMDASYLRLKNIEIGYTMPFGGSKFIGAQKIRFSFQAQNLFTIDNMKSKYVDPEIETMSNFQPYRVFNIGVNLIF